MNKKSIVLPVLMGMMGASAMADVTVNFPAGTTGEYEVESMLISESVKPRNQRGPSDLKALVVNDGKASFEVLPSGAARSALYVSDRDAVMLYTMPGDNLTVDIVSMEPLAYTVSGSPLMEAVSLLDAKGDAIVKEYREISRSENPDQSKLEDLKNQFNALFTDYIAANQSEPAAVYALLQLDGEDYLQAFEALPASAAETPLYPLAQNKKDRVVKSIEADRKMAELQSGDVDAPLFTLKNQFGKEVSLSDFRGKWVILDFWGTWCPWCIKGFPALKEAYAQYKDRLEVIGIDCRDSEEAWKKGIEKYELPWVQVYNPEATAAALLESYAVQGFPTKVIINPEGKIVNITVGEDPNFFNVLADFMK
ncbi:MAG: TlpA family protein disulfide reductase [Muribaculaceae bacterium]|nr:TlpA family protein disulfide reductase [Muribaculaceae bacterium]